MRKSTFASAGLLLVICVSIAGSAQENEQKQSPPDLSSRILTPPAPATPRINGPSVYGQRPGRPFLYTIAATGDRPMTFSAEKLPDGLKLDEKTGRITGSVAAAGNHDVTLRAHNDKGEAQKSF